MKHVYAPLPHIENTMLLRSEIAVQV